MRLLLERLRAVSDVRPAMLGGKAPARWLLERLSALRLRQPESALAATSQPMRLPDRSRYYSPEQLGKSERPAEDLISGEAPPLDRPTGDTHHPAVQGRKPLPATATASGLGGTNRIAGEIQRLEPAAGGGERGDGPA